MWQKSSEVISAIQSIKSPRCPLQSSFLLVVTTVFAQHYCPHAHEITDLCNKATDANPDKSTEAILQELFESISSLKKEVMELKKQDTAMLSKTYPKKRPCDGKDPVEMGGNSEGLKDIEEDHISSEVCILLEEGEAFMETVFGSS